MASRVRASTRARTSAPRNRANSSMPSIELSVLSQSKQMSFNPRGYFLALRLNFEVNFSTRPAVSTRRFSPV